MEREWLAAQKAAGRTDQEIADEVGINWWMVGYFRRKWKIASCSRSESAKKALKKKYPNGRHGPLAGNWRGGRSYSARSGPKSPLFKGRWKTSSGYMRIWKPEHPAANRNGYVYEHRLVMEEKLGRLLFPGEIVDHIDRDRLNNHPDNLRLHPSRSEHVRSHFAARDELTKVQQELARYKAKYGELSEDEENKTT